MIEQQQQYQQDSDKLGPQQAISDSRAEGLVSRDFAALSEKPKKVQNELDISIKKLAADNTKAERKLFLILQTAFQRHLIHNLSARLRHQYIEDSESAVITLSFPPNLRHSWRNR